MNKLFILRIVSWSYNFLQILFIIIIIYIIIIIIINIININIIIINIPWEFFTSVLADGFSLECEWQ